LIYVSDSSASEPRTKMGGGSCSSSKDALLAASSLGSETFCRRADFSVNSHDYTI